MNILTAHGWLSFQPPPDEDDGTPNPNGPATICYRPKEITPGIWEDFQIIGLFPPPPPVVVPPEPGHPPVAPPATDDTDLLGCGGTGLDLVQCLHEKIQPRGSLTKALDLTRRVAFGMGAGLLEKTTGENILDYHGRLVSAGRICFWDGHIIKVLSDVGGEGSTNGPSWQDDGEHVDPRRYVPLVRPGPTAS